jgi:hypothetical protein
MFSRSASGSVSNAQRAPTNCWNNPAMLRQHKLNGTWSLPKIRPNSCKDWPAFQRLHMSFRCCSESFTRRLSVINTTFREKIYSRWCCIDRLTWQDFSGTIQHLRNQHGQTVGRPIG